MEYKILKQGITSVKGFTAAGIHCGLSKKEEKKDLGLIYADTVCTTAAVYTKNPIQAAPISVTKDHLKNKQGRAILCNSVNANAATSDGVETAKQSSILLAQALNIPVEQVIVASTGVIGKPLPIQPIQAGIPTLVNSLNIEGHQDFAKAIMTTDLIEKEYGISFDLSGQTVSIGAVAKGSGMIHPNMGTMLAFISTDINIDADLLQKALSQVVDQTFNMVSVDGDCSTNDMVTILANGQAKNTYIEEENLEYTRFVKALTHLCEYLAKKIASDGEGATKLVECVVKGHNDWEESKAMAKAVISSSLVKTAMFGADANWGRVICALGYACENLDPSQVSIGFSSHLGNIEMCKKGIGVEFSELKAKNILLADRVCIEVRCGNSDYEAKAWGCDLSYDYVKINGEYRS